MTRDVPNPTVTPNSGESRIFNPIFLVTTAKLKNKAENSGNIKSLLLRLSYPGPLCMSRSKRTMPPIMIKIPRPICSVIFSFSSINAMTAVKAGPVAIMEDDTDGPIRSKLIKYSHLTRAGENIPAMTKYGKALDFK